MTVQQAGYFQYYTAGERAALVKGCDISHHQYDQPPYVIDWDTMKTQGDYVTHKAGGQYTTSFSGRYVRFSANGNTSNTTTTFNDGRLFDGGGEILAGRTVTASNSPTFGALTDFIDGDNTTYVVLGTGYRWIKIDVGSIKSLTWVSLQLYYLDGRTWHDVIIEYSTDNVNWTNLYDSNIAGELPELNGGLNLFKYAGMAVDNKFLTANITAARAAGLKVGAYWFHNPNYYDTTNGWLNSISQAELEATTFYNYIVAQLGANDMGDIFPMLDFENQNGEIYPAMTNDVAYDFIEAFKNKFKLLSGRQIILYTAFYTIDNFTTVVGNELYHSTKGGIGAKLPLNLSSISVTYPSYGFTAFGTFYSNKWVNWQFKYTGGDGATWGVTSTDIDLDVLEGDLYTMMPPTKPTGLAAIAGDGQIVLNWNANPDTDKRYYNIFKDDVYYDFIAATLTTYTVSGLTNGTQYTFSISCTDDWEGGIHSDDVLATPLVGGSSTELSAAIFPESFCTGDLYKTLAIGLDIAETDMFEFAGNLYILTGTEYYVYTSAGNAIPVAGYIPKVAIATTPAGGIGTTVGDGLGRLYEQLNVLTGKKRQTFSPDGTAADFFILEQNVTSIDKVYKNGILLTLTTDYTVDLALGKVHFVVVPITGNPSNVEIYWTKGAGQRSLIEGCRFEMEFSGQTDSRIFLWGNESLKNRRFWSGLADGVPSAEYFEANSFDDLGTGEFAISDIVKQYDRQKIFFEVGGGAMFSYYSADTDIIGNTVVSFPTFELNEYISNSAFHQVRIVNNTPYTINKGVYQWLGSNVRDQTNARLISQRVKVSLDEVDLSTAITYNWIEQKEYWLCVGSKVWIHNYLNDTWYNFSNIAATQFYVIAGEMYFGTASGSVEKFQIDTRNDNGVAIPVYWEMAFYDFGADWRLKYINRAWIAINSSYRTSLDVAYVTNVDNGILNASQTISFNVLTFNHINFAHFSFATSYNPQPFSIDIDVQRFVYFKFILSKDDPATTVTVISINMQGRLGGKI